MGKIFGSKWALDRWRAAKVLFIDEISMLDSQLFDKLEEIARRVRFNSPLPFGGIQVLISGTPACAPALLPKDYHREYFLSILH